MQNDKIPVVVLSGGSEIVTISLLEAFLQEKIPVIVIGLGKPSIIRNVNLLVHDYLIDWPPTENTFFELESIVKPFVKKYGIPLPLFVTEDSGLRFIFENRERLSALLTISQGCEGMQYGGLDKAEFSVKVVQEIPYYVPTVVIDEPEEIKDVFSFFGEEIVIKPGLKPYSMDLSELGAKAKIITGKNINDISFFENISKSWKISKQWVAQPLLGSPRKGEYFFGGFREKNGNIIGMTGYGVLKQPRFGGTSCWVKIDENKEIEWMAHEILNKLNYVGICEMEFMLDKEHRWKLLEFNPRPWLQIGLFVKLGMNLPLLMYNNLLGIYCVKNKNTGHILGGDWVNAERLLIASLSGEYASRTSMLYKFYRILRKSSYKSVYDCPFPAVRKRWIMRIAKKIIPFYQ